MPLRFTLLIVASLSVTIARAQWTKSDSPKINSLLKDKKEIKINRNEINNIQFDNRIINKPLRPERSNNLKFDETLPDIGKDKFNFTLRPYKPYTPFNRDPYFRCKIVHVGGIWIPIKAPKQYTEYLQAKRMSNDLFAQLTHTVEPDSVDILFGHTTPSNGAAVMSGDFMILFEKHFWQWQRNKNRKKTMELLKDYDRLIPEKKAQ